MSLLKLKDVTKDFGSIRAVQGVNLDVKEGTIHALIGTNGAGKTTLINIITGVLKPSSGEVNFRGKDISRESAHRIARQGIARTFQNVRTFATMSVMENVVVGIEQGDGNRGFRRTLGNFFLRSRDGRKNSSLSVTERRAREILEKVGLTGHERKLAGELSFVNQRRLEIARALGMSPRLLLLDEPSAGMTMQESVETQELMFSLCRQGITIILVSHEMRLVVCVANKVSVIHFGEKIAEGTAEEVMGDRRVVEAYLGVREETYCS
jgi:ABC-type branched-subunit amino acid transport system ATPase component